MKSTVPSFSALRKERGASAVQFAVLCLGILITTIPALDLLGHSTKSALVCFLYQSGEDGYSSGAFGDEQVCSAPGSSEGADGEPRGELLF